MIVVFGSINVDFVVAVPRLPLPGETVTGEAFVQHPGGKGANQALAAARAGAAVALVGAVGSDRLAADALALLAAQGVDLGRVAARDGSTGAAFIALDAAGENQIVVASGANRFVSASQLDGLALSPADTLLLQREVPEAECVAAAGRARAAGARVILNTAPADGASRALIAAADILVMNGHEALAVAAALGLGKADSLAGAFSGALAGAEAEAEAEAAAAAIGAHIGAATLVTLGPADAVARFGGRRVAVAPPPVTVVDTVAAGDAFCGALAAALDGGADMPLALRHAVAAGSLACTRAGAQPSLPLAADIAAMLARGW